MPKIKLKKIFQAFPSIKVFFVNAIEHPEGHSPDGQSTSEYLLAAEIHEKLTDGSTEVELDPSTVDRILKELGELDEGEDRSDFPITSEKFKGLF